MTQIDDNGPYRAEIPGQQLGTTITYFVKAADSDGNETRDSNFTFEIKKKTGICGADGAADMTSIQNPVLRKTVNATLNIIFFLLPLYLIKGRSGRRKAWKFSIKPFDFFKFMSIFGIEIYLVVGYSTRGIFNASWNPV